MAGQSIEEIVPDDYSTPQAVRYLRLAMKIEDKGMSESSIVKMLDKAIAAEAAGE